MENRKSDRPKVSSKMKDNFDLGNWLNETVVFHGLSSEQLISVIQICELQTFKKGELIFKEGSESQGFYIVKSGRIAVCKVSHTGKEQILDIFETKDNFAEVAALDGKPFPASAYCLEAAELLFLPRNAFLDLLRQYPDIAINMLIELAQHTRHLSNVIQNLSFKEVPQRLAAYILNLNNSQTAKNSSNVIELDLTKSQLAAYLGTIPATLSRAFYRLSAEGIIMVNGSQIEVLDRDRLLSLSQSLE